MVYHLDYNHGIITWLKTEGALLFKKEKENKSEERGILLWSSS